MTSISTMRRFALVALTVLLSACAALNGATTPKASDEWMPTLSLAQAHAARGDFDVADSLLSAFAVRHAGSNEALETAYWRALFKMDPSNRGASLQVALASLDGYLSDTRRRQHVTEAMTLRRAAAQLSELNKLAANAMSQARDARSTAANASAAAADAKDAAKSSTDVSADASAEIKRLKDELAKANAELDRIRKRLSQPPPPHR